MAQSVTEECFARTMVPLIAQSIPQECNTSLIYLLKARHRSYKTDKITPKQTKFMVANRPIGK